jgi:hypothetical protein
MKKIILALDGTHFPAGAFEFVRKLNELNPVLVTGVFLPQAQLASLWTYADAGPGAMLIALSESDDPEQVQKNIDKFSQLCQANFIDYRVHKDFYASPLIELKQESRFADLLILGSEVFYEDLEAGSPNEYLRLALQDVSCPVLLVPEKFEFPESTILAYDGSEDSVFAIKQFAYLFPELTGKQTLLVYANQDPAKDFPEKVRIEELAARHFNDLTLFKLELDPKKHFNTWLQEARSSLLVCGAFGRSGLSQLFKKSFARGIIAEHRLPVFIAHR